MDHSIGREVVGLWVFVLGILKPFREAGQVMSVERSNDRVARRNGKLGFALAEAWLQSEQTRDHACESSGVSSQLAKNRDGKLEAYATYRLAIVDEQEHNYFACA
jgi:hypothetical protein